MAGMMTYERARQVLEEGGTLSHKGRMITGVGNCPSPEEFAGDDLSANQALMEDLDRQAADIAQRRATVSSKIEAAEVRATERKEAEEMRALEAAEE